MISKLRLSLVQEICSKIRKGPWYVVKHNGILNRPHDTCICNDKVLFLRMQPTFEKDCIEQNEVVANFITTAQNTLPEFTNEIIKFYDFLEQNQSIREKYIQFINQKNNVQGEIENVG